MGPDCSYADWQIFGLIVFGYLCGFDRLSHFEELSRGLTVQHLLGLAGPIEENTFGLSSQKSPIQAVRATESGKRRLRHPPRPVLRIYPPVRQVETEHPLVGVRIFKDVRHKGLLLPKKSTPTSATVAASPKPRSSCTDSMGTRGVRELDPGRNAQMGADKTLVHQFWANDLLWQLAILTYNLSLWLRRLTDLNSVRQEQCAFRAWFIRCARKLARHARRLVLKMQASYHWGPPMGSHLPEGRTAATVSGRL